GNDRGSIVDVITHHDPVGVEGLGKLDRARTGGLKSLGQSQVIERIQAVGPAHGGKSRGGKTTAQEGRRSLPNPFEAGLTGAVVKRKHEQNAASAGTGTRGSAGGLGRTLRPGDDNYSQTQGKGQLRTSGKPRNPVEAQ